MNKTKLDQLLSFKEIQKINVLCLTDTRLSRKASKACGNDARKLLGPNVAICPIGYIPGIMALSMRRRKKVKSSKELGGLMFIFNNEWGDKLINFKNDPTGLGVLSSIQ